MAFFASAVFMFLVFYNVAPSAVPFTEDIGLTMMVANEGVNGNLALLGPPSHRGGRHLGPIYYYISSSVLWLSRGDLFVASNLFFLLHVSGVLIAARVASMLFSGGIVFLATVLAGTTPFFMNIIHAPWHSHMLLPASAFFLYSAVRFKEKGDLPLFILSSTILLQMHYSSGPLILAVSLLTIGFSTIKREMLLRAIYAPYTLLAALLWIPPAWFEISHGPNLIPTLLGSDSGEKAGLHEALFQLSLLVRQGLPIGIVPWWLATLVFGLAVWRLRHDEKVFWILKVGVLSTFFYVVTLTLLSKPLHLYFLYSLLPLLLIFVGVLVGGILKLWSRERIFGKLALTSAAMILGAGLFFGLYKTIRSTKKVLPYHSLLHASEVASVVRSKDEAARIVTASASKFMHGAFMAHLSRESIRDVQYFNSLVELEKAVPPRSEINVSYLVACPKIYSREIKALEAGPLKGWARDTAFSFFSCTTCRGCLFRRYTKR